MRSIAYPSQWEIRDYTDPIFLCDSNTAVHCLPLVGEYPHIILPAGEQSKSLDQCAQVWDRLIELKARRSSTLICLGGGMICDLGAFAASVYQRGMRYVLAPTSLLAMVDAAIGGKTAVDYRSLKNFIGLFQEADETVIIPAFLQSLPQKEVLNGRMEMLKHGLIHDPEHYYAVLRSEGLPALELIEASIRIKEYHTRQDPRELGIRKRLNFGHTIGHALESLAFERSAVLPHGLAVGLGMLAEAYLSVGHWSMAQAELDQLEAELIPLLKPIDPQWLEGDPMPFIQMDKKNEGDQIRFTLLNHIGSAQENVHVPQEDIPAAIDYLKKCL